ncbi:predicted protein [Phaeodactylum tricornutum CCAP 1055/1]|jgi:tRNA A37 threonylcarbamoyladenosine dehydratase|uniref:THIF-type NAD/FAD binding fold domain-containing protein n=3 Tax=Phaeodactylum tricornutum TaxID=2850 RepID=B7FYA9_PHATC|nr:predicted protein [Phaeodactylum tricornutum CCAP 1055/1]EEC48890.1 predicted protein [Phaeodactylum tricornutum CCAP 1055/1]|eukprot:XP_002179904.1 predicted protein [Phaeodactylum tricornutum CCAP 1055/1]
MARSKLLVLSLFYAQLVTAFLSSLQPATVHQAGKDQKVLSFFAYRRSPLLFVSNDESPSVNIDSANEHNLRFSGVGRLYTDHNVPFPTENPHLTILDSLMKATVVVIGLGGVGSWSAEALCRSGIGNLVLIDMDDICISNTNRQVHTLSNTVGRMKIEEMKSRLLGINPDCNVTLIHDFVGLDNVNELFQRIGRPSAVLDAIDGSNEKAALLAACVDRRIPVVTVGGAAGITDPTQIVCEDLTMAFSDKLLGICRKTLRKSYGFARGLSFHEMQREKRKVKKWHIAAVYSLEGQKAVPTVADTSSFRRCDGALGTACFVTGTFGFIAASRIVDMIAKGKLITPRRG